MLSAIQLTILRIRTMLVVDEMAARKWPLMQLEAEEPVVALRDCADRNGRRWHCGSVGRCRSSWGCGHSVLLQAFPTDSVLWFGPDKLIIGHATRPVSISYHPDNAAVCALAQALSLNNRFEMPGCIP